MLAAPIPIACQEVSTAIDGSTIMVWACSQ